MTPLEMIISLALDIYRRHAEDHPGQPPLTDPQVARAVRLQLDDNDSAIAQWFLSKGLPLPQ